MLRLSQGSKRHDHIEVLAPMDLQVPNGETRLRIGPSCGGLDHDLDYRGIKDIWRRWEIQLLKSSCQN